MTARSPALEESRDWARGDEGRLEPVVVGRGTLPASAARGPGWGRR
jgi:hypothetical protein